MLTVETGQTLTIWTARAAAALYVVTLVLLLQKKCAGARLASTMGLLTYLLHVGLAFHFFYGWSHTIAFRETARQTEELFGVRWGGGLYLNYLFTLLWCAECTFSWVPSPRQHRSRTLTRIAIHAFLVFMTVNATVVVWLLRARRGG